MKRSKKEIRGIPSEPGIYFLYDSRFNIIYIGKAKKLKVRLASYFHSHSDTYKTSLLKKTFHYYDFIVTANEYEALLLENVQIKKHKPKFNIMLKDDKSYPYLAYNKNLDYPYLYFTRVKKRRKNTIYFGPYTDSNGAKKFLNYLLAKYKLRWCKGKLDSKPCIYYSLSKCLAPCIKRNLKEAYNENFKKAIRELNYPKKELIKNLEKIMNDEASILKFENAAFYRDVLNFLTNKEMNYIVNQKGNFDVIDYVFKENLLLIGIFHFLEGALLGIYTQSFDHFNNESDQQIDFLERYYLDNHVPERIILSEKINGNKIRTIFKDLLHKKTKVKIATNKSKDIHYIKTAEKNLNCTLTNILKKKELINFNSLFPIYPNINIVDGFDISHLFGTHTIGGVVRFRDFIPEKEMYRHYILTSEIGNPDDYRSIYQTVLIHLKHLKKHDYPLPQMLLIDGGRGQIGMAKKAVDELGLDLPILSIAKGKNEKLYKIDKKKIILSKDNPLLKYIIKIRDEAHRHSIEWHRKKRDKSST